MVKIKIPIPKRKKKKKDLGIYSVKRNGFNVYGRKWKIIKLEKLLK
jgi:hypothetical protein